MIFKYGEIPLPILYTNDELNGLMDLFIKKKKEVSVLYFSYKEICNYLFREAQNNSKLQIESDVIYNSPVLAEVDATRISFLLWTRIWSHTLFIDFYYNKYTNRYPGDIRFYIL